MLKKLLFLFFLISSLFLANYAYANESGESSKIVTLSREEVYEGDFFAAGDEVYIYGIVNGDAYVAGGMVVVDGTVNGDLISAGGVVKLNGIVSQDVRVAGGNIDINGQVGRNLTLVGGNINLNPSASVSGSLTTAGGNIHLSSAVSSINAAGGNIIVSGNVADNARIAGGRILFSENVQVGGDLIYYSEEDIVLMPGATIAGEIQQNQIPVRSDPKLDEGIKKGIYGSLIGLTIAVFLSALLMAWLLLRLVPNFLIRTSEVIKAKPWMALIIGLIALFITPMVSFILMITVIGLPLGILLMVWYFIALYFAKFFSLYYLADYFSGRTKANLSLFIWFIIVLAGFYLLSVIPVLGGLVKFVIMLIGFGSLLMAKKDVFQSARAKKLV